MIQTSFDFGIPIRLSRIFNEKSGRSVVVALDHGIAMGTIAGLENLGKRIEQVIEGRPEGVLLNPGAIRRYGHLLTGREAPAAILAVDFPMFFRYPGGEAMDGQVPTISAEEAARMGADMVKICMIFGQEKTVRQILNFEFVAKTIEKCHRVGLPVMVEPTTWGLGFTGKETKEAALLAGMARIAFEIGADVVKSDFPNDPYEMERIAEACPVPIVLLGGSKSPDIETMLGDVLVCVQRGASGVTFGRNVWQHPEPQKMIRAIQSIVHDEDLEGALRIMRQPR
jgi:fructose-bisphosphate aldolase, class I